MGVFEARCKAFLEAMITADALLDGQIIGIDEEHETGKAIVWMYNATNDNVELRDFFLYITAPDTLTYKEMVDLRTITNGQPA